MATPTQAQYAAAIAKVRQIYETKVTQVEGTLSAFVRPQVEGGIRQHQAEIDADLIEVAKATADAVVAAG
jgi:hypothetical protein